MLFTDTASRVLNGHNHVSPGTRARVLATINKLDFRPHAQARRIVSRRSGMVCFLLSNRDFLHSFHARILQGVETYASSLRQHVVFAAVHYDEKTPVGEILLPPILQERGWADGLILAGTIYPNFMERIRSVRVPFVTFGTNVIGPERLRRFDQVSFDGAKAEFEVTRYVARHGHRVIAFVGDTHYPWFQHRLQGYLRAMRKLGFGPVILAERREETFQAYGE
ncbi:MAG: LacI family DNA-binding transcriptional regulator [Terriglobia bacterium]